MTAEQKLDVQGAHRDTVTWEDIPHDSDHLGFASRAVIGNYIAVVRTCEPSEISQFRNRIWTVYWRKQEIGAVLARGCCYSSDRARRLALAVIHAAS